MPDQPSAGARAVACKFVGCTGTLVEHYRECTTLGLAIDAHVAAAVAQARGEERQRVERLIPDICVAVVQAVRNGKDPQALVAHTIRAREEDRRAD